MSTETDSAPLTFKYGRAPQQFGELYLPATSGPYPVVIVIHGGFWHTPYDRTLMTDLAQDLATHGFAAWNIEYRRVGDPSGGYPGTLRDVARAADYLGQLAPSLNLDLTRVITLGHSAGGHLAFWLAARPNLPVGSELERASPLRLLAAISLAGALDLEHVCQLRLGNDAARALLGGSPRSYPERYALASPAALLPLGIPQILIHGRNDDRVPLIVSKEYAAKATLAGDEVKLIKLPDVDHFALIDASSEAWQITRAEVQRLLS